MFSLLFGVGMGEVIWIAVEKQKFTLQYAKGYTWFLTGMNFLMAIFSGSIPNLEISIILLCYVLVIYNLREIKNVK